LCGLSGTNSRDVATTGNKSFFLRIREYSRHPDKQYPAARQARECTTLGNVLPHHAVVPAIRNSFCLSSRNVLSRRDCMVMICKKKHTRDSSFQLLHVGQRSWSRWPSPIDELQGLVPYQLLGLGYPSTLAFTQRMSRAREPWHREVLVHLPLAAAGRWRVGNMLLIRECVHPKRGVSASCCPFT